MIQKMTSLILIIALLLITVPTVASAEVSDESSYYYIVIDQDTGAILLEQNSHNRIFPASTTKILTAYTALANSGVTSIVTASPVAAGPMETGAVRLGLSEGEEMELFDMLMALMLRSANDVAVAIAEYIGGSVENFSDMANEKAALAGALDTHFVNPHGLHDDEHYTTPYDLAMITRKALDNYNFASIVSRSEYTLPVTNKRDKTYTIKNSNPILGENEGMDFLVTGVKTGYTSKAKFTLVSSAHDYTGREVVCVVANMPSRSVSAEYSLELMKRAFDEFAIQSITTAGGIITDNLPSNPGFAVASAMNIEYLLPRNENLWDIDSETVIFTPDGYRPEKGEIVGITTYTHNGVEIGSTYLVSAEDLAYKMPKTKISIGADDGIERASFPIRFIIPLGLAVVAVLLFFFFMRYNKKEVEE
jgi:D-alanyl-D-alanine carboxypeptidase